MAEAGIQVLNLKFYLSKVNSDIAFSLEHSEWLSERLLLMIV